LKTPLHSWHVANAGRMVDFAGWQMPIQYKSIIDEHQATRNSATLFDVSHMGRFVFSGSDVESFIDRMTTRKVAGMAHGGIRYSLVCNSDGGILDDILVYRLGTVDGGDQFTMVVNASNRSKLWDWLHSNVASLDVTIHDATTETAMIAIQGPTAISVVNQHLNIDVNSLKYFTGCHAEFDSVPLTVSRTGYTGEDGCEIVVTADAAEKIWTDLMTHDGVSAAGLGARDTLRLEAAMPLYGHELSESINPAQTNLRFAISLKERDFVGKNSIVAAMSDDAAAVRVGLSLDGRRAAREESEVYHNDEKIGIITSGTFSPTLQTPIAMGYVHPSATKIGTELFIDVRGRKIPAKIVQLPFYKRK